MWGRRRRSPRPSPGATSTPLPAWWTTTWYDRIVDVAEELFKITVLLKGQTGYLADRYSEKKESYQELSSRVNQDKI